MERKIKVVQMGLGPIGNKATIYLAERAQFQIVGAVDLDPAKVGQDVGMLAGLPPLGIKVTANLDSVLKSGDVDVVLLTTASSLVKVEKQLAAILPYGVNVVSSCEELSYPWQTHPELAAKIDSLAKSHNVSVLSTGVNPGFLMDFLPIAMTGVCRNVSKITIERYQDATFRRIPFQKKIGAGLTLDQFHNKIADGTLRHVGLTESMHMIAAKLGWKLDKTEDKITPIIASQDVNTEHLQIKTGMALGVQQIGRGLYGENELIRMVFRAAIGEPETHDRIIIDGSPAIDSCIKGGVNGDVATCAILINAIPATLNARPGLRTMADIEPISCFA
ncbi:MAG: dihydrodipicolinate reductase [Anaerosporomusa subterranea]|jgi:4-hydroxy-tetrahydrodipicolinate reductase|nr:dihydrodipicolinate reductase [Anaerosporomusa subterranea]